MKGKRKVFSQLPFVFLGKKFLLSLRKKYSSSSAKPCCPSVLNSSPLISSSLDFYSSTHSFSTQLISHPPIHPSFIYLSTHPSCHPFFYSSIHPSTHPVIHLSIHPSLHQPPTHPSFHHPSILPSCIHPAIYPSGQQAKDSEPHPFLGLQGPQGQVR